MLGNNYLLWENQQFIICTPFNPHYAYIEGPIVIIKSKQDLAHSWESPTVTGHAFELAAKAAKILEQLNLAPWFNLQSNGNWGLLSGSSPFFHVYIYGRNETERWAKPLVLPEAPKTYNNDPMPESDRDKLVAAFKAELK